ncbi:hypothetical protein [Telmatospirillum sp. J64-1]|uniref:hypothetical protein n=1 Tax=Telmatospirillum sp. J64-1 TaxID=2502183 RepID=UPI00115F0BCA|nr:hypothetical protein [Telmatospirillum sp. J64-1]
MADYTRRRIIGLAGALGALAATRPVHALSIQDAPPHLQALRQSACGGPDDDHVALLAEVDEMLEKEAGRRLTPEEKRLILSELSLTCPTCGCAVAGLF